jgi:GT2 family glycosyltransferase
MRDGQSTLAGNGESSRSASGSADDPSRAVSSSVSIVLPVYNEGCRLRETLDALRDTVRRSYEVVVVNDGSTDGCCDRLAGENLVLVNRPHRQGVAQARNLGAARATGSVLVMMDAHCVPHAGWLEALLEQLDQPGTGIVAPQIISIEIPSATAFGLRISDEELGLEWLHQRTEKPYPVPLVGCACMAMHRAFFEKVGRFDEMRSYGMEDVEICIRSWLLGYAVTVVPDACVGHWFKKEPFAVGWHDSLYNRLRTAVLHFDGERLQRILAALQTKPCFGEAVSSLLVSDIWARRELVRAGRKHDAEWFCRTFDIAL